MQFAKALILASLLTLTSEALAYAPKEGNVSAILGPFLAKTNFNSSGYQPTTPYLGGAALIVQGDVSDHGALEIGMFHMRKVYFREQRENFIAEQTELMHITMGYRRWITPTISASWAFFSAYSMGEPKVVHSAISTGSDLNTSAHDNTEYGLDFSLQGEVWSQGRYAVILDGRYSLSLTPKEGEKADHFGFLVGLKYFIQEKQFKDKPKDAI